MDTPFHQRCGDCVIGYHAPFERFERIAVIEAGPSFLMRCRTCGSLWDEALHDAKLLCQAEAIARYPQADFES